MDKATRRLASILETHCRYAGRSISPGELVQAASTADPAAPHERIRDLETEGAIIGVLTRGTRTPEGMIAFRVSEATSYDLDQQALRRLLAAEPDQDLDDDTGPPDTLLAKLSKQQRRMIEFVWDKPAVGRHKFVAHVWNGTVRPNPKTVERQVQRLADRLLELLAGYEISINDEFVEFGKLSAK